MAIGHSVELLTIAIMSDESREKTIAWYYNMILSDWSATITKIIDRCYDWQRDHPEICGGCKRHFRAL